MEVEGSGPEGRKFTAAKYKYVHCYKKKRLRRGEEGNKTLRNEGENVEEKT